MKISFVIMDKILRKQIVSGIINLFVLFFLATLAISLLVWGWKGGLLVLLSFAILFGVGYAIEYYLKGISSLFEKVFFSQVIDRSFKLGFPFVPEKFFARFDRRNEATEREITVLETVQRIEQEQKKTLSLLSEQKRMISEMEGVVYSYDDKIARTILEVMGRYERRFKNGLLDEILGETFEDSGYARSETYEREKHANEVKEQERDLERRSFRLEVKEELQDQRSTVQDVRTEMIRGFTAHEMKFVEMGASFTEKLSAMAEKIGTIREYLVEKILSLDKRITEESNGIKNLITALKYELKTDVTDLKIQVNDELVRLDKQQHTLVSHLELYEAKMLGFTNQVDRLKIEAQTYNLKGQEMLGRAESIYQHHKAELRLIDGKIQQGLKLVSVHKEDFANSVGRAKIMMDRIAQDQYHSMKDVAYERMGVEMLRQDYSTRMENETLKLREIQTDIRNTQRLIDERLRNEQQVAGLQHQLFMSRESEAYTSQRLGLLREENSLVRRLYR
ncbi:MAG: hypothetical protein AAGG81_08470 [Chlamydiota bacterium]